MKLGLRDGEKLAVAVVTAVAAASYFGNISQGLVPGEGLAAAASCLFGSGSRAPMVWSILLSAVWSMTDGWATSVRLGLVSAFAGTVAAGAFTLVLCRVLTIAVGKGNKTVRGTSCGIHFRWYPVLCGGVGGLAFAFTPGVFAAATHAGPLTTVMALTALSYALVLSCARHSVRTRKRLLRFSAAGVCVALAAFEGVFGLALAPFAFACTFIPATWGKKRPTKLEHGFLVAGAGTVVGVLLAYGGMPSIQFTWQPVYLHLLCLAVLPPLLFSGLISHRGGNEGWVRVVAGWAVVVAVAALVCRADRTKGLGPDAYVQGAMRELGDRRWIVSDGPFDNLILFRRPAGAQLLSLAREGDLDYGQQLAAVVRREMPEADNELLTAAEIGPAQFLDVWLRRGTGATNCVFVTLLEPVEVRDRRTVRPCAYCWRPEAAAYDPAGADAAWRAAWREVSPFLKGRDAWDEMICRRFAVHGNAIGSRLQDVGLNEAAWKAYSLAQHDMDGENLSLLMNMVNLGRRGLAASASVLEQLTDALKTKIGDLPNRRERRLRQAEGGGVFLTKESREEILRRRKAARQEAWNSPAGRLVREGFEKLQAAATCEGAERKRAVDEIERLLARKVQASSAADWVKSLFFGELARLKGGEALKEAQGHFRQVLGAEAGDDKFVFDRLLAIDLALGDRGAIERDAIAILRRDATNSFASALIGSVRLANGNAESAVRFLQRAAEGGTAAPAVLNDLALALARTGRRDEARAMVARAEKAMPGNPHIQKTKEEVFAR